MAVKKYKNTDRNILLTKNFTSGEFFCRGKGCCTESKIDDALTERLQRLRDAIGMPINVNSGCRCEKRNKAVGGAANSKHLSGMAADIVCPGITPLELARCAEALGFKCVILYTAKNFVHVDTRTTKYLAVDNSKDKPRAVSTHGKPTIKLITEPPTPPPQICRAISLRLNSKNAIVNGTLGAIDAKGSYPYILNGRTMVPVRFTSEKMGATVAWTGNANPVAIEYGSCLVMLTVGSKTISVTKDEKATGKVIDQAPTLKNGRIYVPLRAVAENLGFSVKYDGATGVIVISEEKLSAVDLAALVKEASEKLK